MKYFFETIKDKNEPLLFYGAICLIGAMICFVLSKYSSIQILGISGWIKPFKFFLSISIFVFTMVLYLQFLENQKQVTIYSWSMIVLFSVELFLIVLQAARGKTSHYNLQTTLDSTISIIMGLTIILFMLHTVFIVLLFYNQKYFEVDENMVLALKLSLLIMVLFAFEGFVMVSVLKHTIGSEDGSAGLPIVNWSKNHGDLRVAHFFGMHSLQLIPLVTYLMAKSKRDVIVISALYFIFVTYTLFHALQGKSITKLGSFGIAVALAMGAGIVIAPGSNTASLAELSKVFGPRVRTVSLTGYEEDSQKIKYTANGFINRVIDILPLMESAAPTKAACMSILSNGSIVLMGGLEIDLKNI